MNISEDEVMAGVVSAIVTFLAWGLWYGRIVGVARRTPAPRLLFAVLPLALATAILAVLRTSAAHDVREAPFWLAWYTVFGLAWVAFFRGVLVFFDLRWFDDALVRANPASAWAVFGAIFGLGAAYAGANIGDGPGWWCVAVAALPASLAVVGAWLAVALGGVAERISVERDRAAGIRTGGLLLAVGMIGGRGAAGDWTSAAATFGEFSTAAWPAVPLVALAAWGEWRGLRVGLPLAAFWLAVAVAVVWLAGPVPHHVLLPSGPE